MVHQYRSNGYNIVLDVNSGAIHVVDDVVYDMIPLFESNDKQSILNQMADRYDAAELTEAYDEIRTLRENRELFTDDIYENYIQDFMNRQTVVKALCLHVAHDCNLACRYCFAEEGEYHGKRSIMSYDVGKRALDFLVANSGSRRNLEVDFFGGEPLMNFKTVERLVAYGRSLEKVHKKRFRFTLTTNGVLLNERIMAFCNKEMDNVVLSIDGRKEVNDRMRPFRNRRGSYDLIVPRFQTFAESRNQEKYYVRGTFTRNNLDFAADVLHLADLGFEQISVEPVVADDGEPYALQPEDVERIKAEYDKLADEMIRRDREGRGFNFFHFMLDLSGGPCVAKRLSGCGSGTEYLAVTPEGDLYPCHQFVGQEAFKMGDIYTGIRNTALQQEFRSVSVYDKPDCRTCFAKFYCSGGCAANAHKFHGDIVSSYETGCELERKRVECAIMIQVAKLMNRENVSEGGVAV